MKKLLLACAAIGALAAATTANATTAVFTFQSPAGDNGTSATYTNNGLQIVASAFGPGSPHLFDKTAGGDESGVGLTNDPSTDDEITVGSFIQIDTNLLPAGTLDSFIMGSTTTPDTWKVFGTNTAGTLSGATSLLGPTTDESVSHSLTSGFRYYDFTAGAGNVLLTSFTAVTAVPEPATWAMMLVGVAGLGAGLRMSRRSNAATALA